MPNRLHSATAAQYSHRAPALDLSFRPSPPRRSPAVPLGTAPVVPPPRPRAMIRLQSPLKVRPGRPAGRISRQASDLNHHRRPFPTVNSDSSRAHPRSNERVWRSWVPVPKRSGEWAHVLGEG